MINALRYALYESKILTSCRRLIGSKCYLLVPYNCGLIFSEYILPATRAVVIIGSRHWVCPREVAASYMFIYDPQRMIPAGMTSRVIMLHRKLPSNEKILGQVMIRNELHYIKLAPGMIFCTAQW